MLKDFCILPECYVDTNLVETLVPPQKGYNHQKGCNTVAKKMKENLNSEFALGIIDKDKKTLDYLKQFEEVVENQNLTLYKHPNKHHYFIQLKPAVERWIWANVEEVALNLSDLGLPTDFEEFRKVAKSETSKNNPNLKRLFKALKKHNASGVKVLENWINYFKLHDYQADIDFFKNQVPPQ